MNKFRTITAIFLSLAFMGLVGCSNGETSSTGDFSDGDEPWLGNWERPDMPDDPIEEIHICGHACYVCGKCLDSTCEDEVCADKCYEAHGRTLYTFNATDSHVERNGGVVIEGDHIGNINQNPNAEIIYRITAEEEVTVCLGATISEMGEDNYVTSDTPIYVNGEPFYSRGYLKAGATTWSVFYTVWLGCVTLQQGENEIKLTNPHSDGQQYNFKDFSFLSDTELSWLEAEQHVCTTKNQDGKCTDYTCNEAACMDKDVTGWRSVELDPGDDRVLKYGTDANGNTVSLWNENEHCIGSIANGSISHISDHTVAFSFEATEETYVRISLSTSTAMSAGAKISDMWTLAFNGVEVTTGAVNNLTDNAGWFNYIVNDVIYLKAQAGRNDFVMVHKNTNTGDNINNIILGYEKGVVTFVQANKPE